MVGYLVDTPDASDFEHMLGVFGQLENDGLVAFPSLLILTVPRIVSSSVISVILRSLQFSDYRALSCVVSPVL